MSIVTRFAPSPTGYIHIWGSEPNNFAIDNIVVTNKDKNPRLIETEYKAGTVIVPEDYIEKYQTFYWEMYQEINMAAVKNNSFVMLEVLNATDEKAGIPPKLLKENKIESYIKLQDHEKRKTRAYKEDI